MGNGKIKFTAHFYKECASYTEKPQFYLYAGKNGGSGCGKDTLRFNRIKINDLTVMCSSQNSTCHGSISKGTEEYIYECELNKNTAPLNKYWGLSTCPELTIVMILCCRTNNNNIGAGSELKVTSTIHAYNLSRCNNKLNSSAQWQRRPNGYFQLNKPVFINYGVMDTVDNDKITYKLIRPETEGTTLSYLSYYSDKLPMTAYCNNPAVRNCAWQPNTYPPRGFGLDSNTGNLIFTPTKYNESGLIVIEATEYRNDSNGNKVWVSKTRQESLHTVIDDSSVYNLAPVITTNPDFYACLNEDNTFTINVNDNPFLPYVKFTDSVLLNFTLPKPNMKVKTYLSPYTKQVSAEISWKPTAADNTGDLIYFTVQANDNFCPHPLETSKAFSIKIIDKDTSYITYNLNPCFLSFEATVNKNKSTAISYIWNLADSTTENIVFKSSKNQDTLRFLNAGTYKLYLYTNSKDYCYKPHFIYIRIPRNLARMQLFADTFLCKGNPWNVRIKSSQNPIQKYSWTYMDTAQHISQDSVLNISKLQYNTTVLLSATDILGCDLKDEVKATVLKLPALELDSHLQTQFCINNQSINLNQYLRIPDSTRQNNLHLKISAAIAEFQSKPLIAADGFRYGYNVGNLENTQLQNGNVFSNTFYYSITDSNGCMSHDSNQIAILGKPIFNVLSKAFCQKNVRQINLDSNLINPISDQNHFIKWNCIYAPHGINTQSTIIHRDTHTNLFQTGGAGLANYLGKYGIAAEIGSVYNACTIYDTGVITLNATPNLKQIQFPSQCQSQLHINLDSLVFINGEPANSVYTSYQIQSKNNNPDSTNWTGIQINNHNFPSTQAGNWQVKSIGTVEGCSDSLALNIQINPKPVADFSSLPADSAGVSKPVFKLQNLSNINPNNLLNYFWNFGYNNSTSTAQNPSITYPAVLNKYTVQLITTSANGCADSIEKTLSIVEKIPAKNHIITNPKIRIDPKLNILNPDYFWYELNLYNVSGSLVYTGKNASEIPLSPGIYWVKGIVKNGSGELFLVNQKIQVLE